MDKETPRETQVKNHAIYVQGMNKDDLKIFIDIAKECLQNSSIEYKEGEKYDWVNILQEAWYSGGDYPDEESEEHAILHIEGCFYKLHQMILKLSHDDLKQCISDMENFFT